MQLDMQYCRRCGAKFIEHHSHVYTCPNKHVIYANASPAVAAIIVNSKCDILVTRRAAEPKKGMLDLPGGYCDGAETLENALYRELQEELDVTPQQYTKPIYLYSGTDDYEYGNETLPFLSCTFVVKLVEDVIPAAKDDVAEAFFVPVNDIKPESFCYSNIQQALTIYINKILHK
jgi:NAD+ diphosphatase